MAKHEYKVGDLARVVGDRSKRRMDFAFPEGDVVRIEHCEKSSTPWCRRDDGLGQYVPVENLEPLHQPQKIVITTDGKTVTAKLYEGKQPKTGAKAVCSPEDTFDLATGAKLALDRLLGVEPEKPKLFPLEDIKAGYLLEVEEDGGKRRYHMTVAPSRREGKNEEILACCCPRKEWWPLREFHADLIYHDVDGKPKITAIYGLTTPRDIMANKPAGRPLLWRRGE